MRTPTLIDIYAAVRATDPKDNVKAGTVRQWVSRGELPSYGHDRRGRILIDVNQLRELVERKNLTSSLTCCNT